MTVKESRSQGLCNFAFNFRCDDKRAGWCLDRVLFVARKQRERGGLHPTAVDAQVRSVELAGGPLRDFLIRSLAGNHHGRGQRNALAPVGLHDVGQNLLGRLFAHKRTACRTVLRAEFDVEQAQVVLNLGNSGHGRLAAAAACALLDSHRGCDADNIFHVGFGRRLRD